MKKTFEGWLFNRLEILGDKKFNHVGCESNKEEFIDFITRFVPKLGMKRKVKFTIEAEEESKIIEEFKKPKNYIKE